MTWFAAIHETGQLEGALEVLDAWEIKGKLSHGS